MSLPALACRLSWLVALGAVLAAPAHAEGNRLLPFWGQPYPYGYAWAARPDSAPYPVATGRNRCRNFRARGHGRGPNLHCDVVLHALD